MHIRILLDKRSKLDRRVETAERGRGSLAWRKGGRICSRNLLAPGTWVYDLTLLPLLPRSSILMQSLLLAATQAIADSESNTSSYVAAAVSRRSRQHSALAPPRLHRSCSFSIAACCRCCGGCIRSCRSLQPLVSHTIVSDSSSLSLWLTARRSCKSPSHQLYVCTRSSAASSSVCLWPVCGCPCVRLCQ